MTPPTCDMTADCAAPVTHIDASGFIYCETHGEARKGGGVRCRKMRPHEVNRVLAGKTVERY